MTRGIEVISNSIAKHYDFKNSSILIIEEMSELTKAITKYVRVEAGGKDMSVKINKAKARKNIVEEMADTLMMIKEVQKLLEITDSEIDKVVVEKLVRSLNLIRQE